MHIIIPYCGANEAENIPQLENLALINSQRVNRSVKFLLERGFTIDRVSTVENQDGLTLYIELPNDIDQSSIRSELFTTLAP